MVSDNERRLLGQIARSVFGRTNAWTTVDDDVETGRLLQSLIRQGLIESYGENGVRLTEDGLNVFETAAAPSLPPLHELEALEHQESEERRRRSASLSATELKQYREIEKSITDHDLNR
jgi:hypothetical protein